MSKAYSAPALLIGLVLLLVGKSTAFGAVLTYTFTLLPASGTIEGPAGSTIGWGYSITNEDPTRWLVTSNLSAGAFVNAAPDASVFDYPIVAPASTVTFAFDSQAQHGLYGLTWDASAPVGSINAGVFTLEADWFTADPSTGGTFLQSALSSTAAYQASVAAVPEPSLLSLLAIGVLMLLKSRASSIFGYYTRSRGSGSSRPIRV